MPKDPDEAKGDLLVLLLQGIWLQKNFTFRIRVKVLYLFPVSYRVTINEKETEQSFGQQYSEQEKEILCQIQDEAPENT